MCQTCQSQPTIAELQFTIRNTMQELFHAARESPDMGERRIDFIASVWEQFSTLETT